MLASQQSASAFISESQKKDLGGAHGQVAFFNNKLDINRFFIDEGEGDEPQVFFSKSNSDPEAGANNNNESNEKDDLFEDELDSAAL